MALLPTTFGAVAVLLASIGPYGALDPAVKTRTLERVRMALGARPARTVALLSREALLLTGVGERGTQRKGMRKLERELQRGENNPKVSNEHKPE